MSKKKFLLFLLTLTTLLTFMTYQNRQGQVRGSGIFGPMLNVSYRFFNTIADGIKSPFKKIAIRHEENLLLKKQVDNLLLENSKSQEALLENRRLKELLKMREYRRDIITSAKVIASGAGLWNHKLTIDKGMQDGIKKNDSAITPKGLAGKISSTSDAFSEILLLTDVNFSASVRLQESRKEGIISGTGSAKVVLKYIPPEHEVKAGDIVITSGLDQLFPSGIPVGYVSKVDKQGNSQFQIIEVIPYTDSSSIEEVVIVR